MSAQPRFRDISKYLLHRCWLIRGPTGVEGTGRGAWGRPLTAATPTIVEASCRVEHKARIFRQSDGSEVLADMRIYFASPEHPSGLGVEVGPEDMVLLDDPDDIDANEQKQYRIARRERYDGWGWATDLAAHWEVWVV